MGLDIVALDLGNIETLSIWASWKQNIHTNTHTKKLEVFREDISSGQGRSQESDHKPLQPSYFEMNLQVKQKYFEVSRIQEEQLG